MSENFTLKANKRERVGKGSSRKLRNEGLIPAVIYGNNAEPVAIAVSYKEVYYKIYGGGFLTNAITIDLDGEKIKVLPKAYELDPVRDFPLHVDFLRIDENSQVAIKLPIHFLNDEICPGIKRGGVLNIVKHDLECLVFARSIPEAIEIDLKNYQIGDAIHLSNIKLPKGAVAVSHEEDMTIATISAPTVAAEEATTEEVSEEK